jgi:hypothetical protein
MTREEIEQKMDELTREYYETNDPEIRRDLQTSPSAHEVGSLREP